MCGTVRLHELYTEQSAEHRDKSGFSPRSARSLLFRLRIRSEASLHSALQHLQHLSPADSICRQLERTRRELEEVCEVCLSNEGETTGHLGLLSLDLRLEVFGEVLGDDLGALDNLERDSGQVGDVCAK